MQSSKEQQEEIRKPSSAINAKKWRKTTEWERLESSSRKLEITKGTKAEDIKKRYQEYMEELYKKDLHDQDNHDDVIINLKPDFLECEVRWVLESITTNNASGGDGIPV